MHVHGINIFNGLRLLRSHLQDVSNRGLNLNINGLNSFEEYNKYVKYNNTIENKYNKINLKLIDNSTLLNNRLNTLNSEITNVTQSIGRLRDMNNNETKLENEQINTIDNQIESLQNEINRLEQNKSQLRDSFKKRKNKYIWDNKRLKQKMERIVRERDNYASMVSNVTKFKLNEKKTEFLQTLSEVKRLCNDGYKQLIKNWKKWDVENTKQFLQFAIDQTIHNNNNNNSNNNNNYSNNNNKNNNKNHNGIYDIINIDVEDSDVDFDFSGKEKTGVKSKSKSKSKAESKINGDKKEIYKSNISKRCNIEGKDLIIVNNAVLKVMGVDNEIDCKKLIIFIKKCILSVNGDANGEYNNGEFENGMNSNDAMLDSQGDMCIVCLEEKANMAYSDCGHISLCQGCYQEWSKDKTYCPQCRRNCNNVIKVYHTGYCG